MKTSKNQPTINFKKIINNKEDLPSKDSVRQMWKDLDKKNDKSQKSEKKILGLEKLTEEKKSTMTTNIMKQKEINNETENNQQQQKPNNNKNKQNDENKTTITRNLKLKNSDKNT